jgi:hypothetical protein
LLLAATSWNGGFGRLGWRSCVLTGMVTLWIVYLPVVAGFAGLGYLVIGGRRSDLVESGR